MPGNAETIIDYDCVPSYSQILAAQIVNMNDNVIIPETSLKSGTIDRQHHCWIQILYVDDIMSLTYPRFLFVRYHQSFKDYHYTLNKHENGYFYIVRNQTIIKTSTDEVKRDKQEIQRLKRALKGWS